MKEEEFDLLDLCEMVPSEYFDFIVNVDGYQRLMIEAEYMLEETYDYYFKAAIDGKYESVKISDKAIKKAEEVMSKTLSCHELMRYIINYMDYQDDGWYWFCAMCQEAAYGMDVTHLVDLVKQHGNEDQIHCIEYIERLIKRTYGKEKSKFYKTENGEFELDECEI